ncbi:MAG: hypothetical protein J3T61_05885 [Candidatus Brocadiales bacterium]|nr:hypothetical protein [Candidatus Bathyanammoxibius sp.]
MKSKKWIGSTIIMIVAYAIIKSLVTYEPQSKSVLTQNFISSNDVFSIRAPNTWSRASLGNPESVLECGDQNDGVFLIGMTDSREEVYATIGQVSIREYADILTSYRLVGLNNPRIQAQEITSLKGYDTARYVVTGDLNNFEWGYLCYFVDVGEYFISLNFMTTRNKLSKYSDTFDKIAQSLTLR